MTDAFLSVRRYRWLDRTTKLLGVSLVAVGLEVGGTTVEGATLGLLGAALALTTVFIEGDT